MFLSNRVYLRQSHIFTYRLVPFVRSYFFAIYNHIYTIIIQNGMCSNFYKCSITFCSRPPYSDGYHLGGAHTSINSTHTACTVSCTAGGLASYALQTVFCLVLFSVVSNVLTVHYPNHGKRFMLFGYYTYISVTFYL